MLMKSDWNESHQNQIKLVEVPQCEKVFPSFLQYFYTGELMITHTNVQPLLSLADKYMVKSLSKLCLQYMYDHVSHASSHNQLFSWLQYFQSCGHKEMARVCEEFIKLNFEAVANSADFVNLDPENMVPILKQDDLVVYNEAMLYKCVVRWLNLQKSKLEENAKLGNDNTEVDKDEELTEYMNYLTVLVMQHVRFPMMKPREIADLLRSPLVKENTEFFMERMSISVELHSGSRENIEASWLEENQHLIQPRLYTAENYSAIIWIEDFTSLPKFHVVSCDFQTDCSVFEDRNCSERSRWVAHFHPKGILFDPCYLIRWQGRYEIPEKVLPTVRLSISSKRLCKPGKFKFSILVYGVRGDIEHVMTVKSEIHYITDVNKYINIDNVIPFQFLNPSEGETQHDYDNTNFTGMHSKELKLQIIVTRIS
ncbi:BTB/POZ domain-containing protein 17 isoform X2 [Coccinella septempunctata]|nr:BTB/POZ domain-containing protein 17 isoform X2 [Coccinella septempunctata]